MFYDKLLDMDIRKYDGQCVRIKDFSGEVFEGICSYNNPEYDEHEFGRNEECLEILSFLFFKSDIDEIESLEGHDGPYGKFSGPYGKLEEMTVQDGIDSIEDALFCEENEHIIRMLRCLNYYLDYKNGQDLPYRDEIIELLKELVDSTDNEEIRNMAKILISS